MARVARQVLLQERAQAAQRRVAGFLARVQATGAKSVRSAKADSLGPPAESLRVPVAPAKVGRPVIAHILHAPLAIAHTLRGPREIVRTPRDLPVRGLQEASPQPEPHPGRIPSHSRAAPPTAGLRPGARVLVDRVPVPRSRGPKDLLVQRDRVRGPKEASNASAQPAVEQPPATGVRERLVRAPHRASHLPGGPHQAGQPLARHPPAGPPLAGHRPGDPASRLGRAARASQADSAKNAVRVTILQGRSGLNDRPAIKPKATDYCD